MAASRSGDKKRVLPSWMTAQRPSESVSPEKTPKRRRKAAVPAAAARPPAMKTVYCMSEAELVDVALGVLIENRRRERASEHRPPAGTDAPEPSPTCSEGPTSPESEGDDRGDAALPTGRGPPPEPACGTSPEEDEDAFKFVREIFFS